MRDALFELHSIFLDISVVCLWVLVLQLMRRTR